MKIRKNLCGVLAAVLAANSAVVCAYADPDIVTPKEASVTNPATVAWVGASGSWNPTAAGSLSYDNTTGVITFGKFDELKDLSSVTLGKFSGKAPFKVTVDVTGLGITDASSITLSGTNFDDDGTQTHTGAAAKACGNLSADGKTMTFYFDAATIEASNNTTANGGPDWGGKSHWAKDTATGIYSRKAPISITVGGNSVSFDIKAKAAAASAAAPVIADVHKATKETPDTMTEDANLQNYKTNLSKYTVSYADGTATISGKFNEMVGEDGTPGSAGRNALLIVEVGAPAGYSVKKGETELPAEWKTDAYAFGSFANTAEKSYVTLWITLTEDRINGDETVSYTFGEGVNAKTLNIAFEDTSVAEVVAPVTATLNSIAPKEDIEYTKTVTEATKTVAITLKEALAENQENTLFVYIPVALADGKTLVYTTPNAADEVAIYAGENIKTPNPDTAVFTLGIALNESGAGSATLTYREHNGTALGAAQNLVTINVTSDIEAGGETPDTPSLTPVTPVDPVAPTTSGSTSTTTSDTTSSAAATVDPVDAKGDADVKTDGTTEVKVGDLGTVTVDAKDVAALEGTKVVVEATNEEKATSEALNTAVGKDASAAVKAIVEAAVKAVKEGNAVTVDISFTKDGKTVQPGKDVTITLPVPSVIKGAEKLFIYHVTDKGLEDITSKCKYDKDKGTVAITNDKFSPYIISKVEIKTAGETTSGSGTTSSSNPSGNPNTGVALAVAPIILAGAAVAIVSAKKRK